MITKRSYPFPYALFRALFFFGVIIFGAKPLHAQPAQDTLYINLNTHAEENDRDPQGITLNYSANQAQYAQYRALVKQIADMVRSKGAKWNYQSDWNFLDGALKYDRGDASTNSKNLFRWMAEDNNGQIQLDPHAHETRYNYADVAKMLDSVSPVVKASKNVGGFTWNGPMAASSLMGMTVRGYSWDSLGKGLQGRVFRTYTWKAEVLLGGASYNPRTMMTSHGNDLNHSGAWRPRDTTATGYKVHTCTAALANLGVGGDALLTDSGSVESDVASVMANIRATIAAMRANRGKFFVMQIQTNQRAFTRAGYMEKIGRILDSVNVLVRTGQVKWATHTEKATAWRTLYNEKPNFYPYTDGIDNCSSNQVALPSTPILISPTNGAVNQPLFTTVQWSPVQGATHYDLHISGDPVFFTTISRDSMITASVTSRRIGEIFPGTTIYWRVRAKNASGFGSWSEGWNFTALRTTSVMNTSQGKVPMIISPNPAQNLVNVKFTLTMSERVSLKIFNALGQEVAQIFDETLPAGEHTRSLDMSHWLLLSGAYFLQLNTQHSTLSTIPLQVMR